jgi:hypothetical protein
MQTRVFNFRIFRTVQRRIIPCLRRVARLRCSFQITSFNPLSRAPIFLLLSFRFELRIGLALPLGPHESRKPE